jgi:putative flippase GtrA
MFKQARMARFSIKTIKDSMLTRFLLVGLLNSLFGYSLFALLLFAGFHYTIATLIATILGVLFNFKTIGVFVFNDANNSRIFKFILVYTVTYLINIACLKVFSLLSIDLYLAGLLLLAPMAFLTFAMNRRFVFGKYTADR